MNFFPSRLNTANFQPKDQINSRFHKLSHSLPTDRYRQMFQITHKMFLKAFTLMDNHNKPLLSFQVFSRIITSEEALILPMINHHSIKESKLLLI